MRKVVLALALMFFVACASHKPIVPQATPFVAESEVYEAFIPKTNCTTNPEACDREAAEAVPLVVAPPAVAMRAMPSGAFLKEVGTRADKVRKNQKSWRDMGSTDKPLPKVTPAQIASIVVETKVKPIFVQPNASSSPAVKKTNLASLAQYIAVSVALAVVALLWKLIKKS